MSSNTTETAFGHQPTMVSVDDNILRIAEHALELAMKHLRDSAIEHNLASNRGSYQHTSWSNRLIDDAVLITAAQDAIRKVLGWPALPGVVPETIPEITSETKENENDKA